jgi:two-component system, chemotaxis family, CheB/CheR fusion protein
MNDELRHHTLELNDVNAFLEKILATIGLAVAVLDGRQHIRIWNGQARELWGLTADDVEDRHLLSLDFGLPVRELTSLLTACLVDGSQGEVVVMEATNRRGKAFRCQVTCVPLGADHDGSAPGVIVLMEALEN